MTKTMNRADVFQAFWGKGFSEILIANAIYAMSCKFLPSLIYKDSMLILWFLFCAILTYIELKELRGFVLELYNPVSIYLYQDEEGILFRV